MAETLAASGAGMDPQVCAPSRTRPGVEERPSRHRRRARSAPP
jgi:hypothetical protein